ncbi:MAG TPA: CBS domain-containing protein [Flavobacterium sp.]|nr:CBS domain-containing protein [Flavobacterium sp.]
MTDIVDFITNDFQALNSTDTIAIAQDLMHESSFSHFPVLESGIYIGCITLIDADLFDTEKIISDYKYTLEPFFVREKMEWLDVLEIFAKNHTNLVPVLSVDNNYLGYYEIEDIITFFHETPFLKEQGGIIVVQKGILDYSMSQIAQIVESNNGKLLGLFVSETTADTIQITVKISLGGMNDIIQTFRRYNYEIISEHQEDLYINNLKDRSDYLNKYLNI